MKTLIRFHSDKTLSRSLVHTKDTSLPCCSRSFSETWFLVFVGELVARLLGVEEREREEFLSFLLYSRREKREVESFMREKKGRKPSRHPIRRRCGRRGREGCFRKFRSLKRKIDSGPPPSGIRISDAHAVVTSCRTPARVSLRSHIYLDTHVIGSQVEILVAGCSTMEQGEEGDALPYVRSVAK